MTAEEFRLVLISVSTTIAVLSFYLLIRNRVVDKKKGLTITYTTNAILEVADDARYSGMVITIYVLNSGNVNIFINRPYLRIPFKKDGYDKFDMFNAKDTVKYPLKLEPGQQHKIDIDILNFLKSFDYIKWYRRIHFEVLDSMGNTYKSKKIWFQFFLKQIELHKSLKTKDF